MFRRDPIRCPRFYQPAIGRFLQSDPIGFGGGDSNLYRYCAGDPVNRTDPSGLTQSDPPPLLRDTSLGGNPFEAFPQGQGISTAGWWGGKPGGNNFYSGFVGRSGGRDGGGTSGSGGAPAGLNPDGTPILRAQPVAGFNPVAFIANDIGAAATGIAANVIGLVQNLFQTIGGIFTPQVDIQQGLSGFVQALVPRYGNFGGPGYGIGRSPNMPPLIGTTPFNPLDAQFRTHDSNYQTGAFSPSAADQRLLNNMSNIPQPGLLGQILSTWCLRTIRDKNGNRPPTWRMKCSSSVRWPSGFALALISLCVLTTSCVEQISRIRVSSPQQSSATSKRDDSLLKARKVCASVAARHGLEQNSEAFLETGGIEYALRLPLGGFGGPSILLSPGNNPETLAVITVNGFGSSNPDAQRRAIAADVRSAFVAEFGASLVRSSEEGWTQF